MSHAEPMDMLSWYAKHGMSRECRSLHYGQVGKVEGVKKCTVPLSSPTIAHTHWLATPAREDHRDTHQGPFQVSLHCEDELDKSLGALGGDFGAKLFEYALSQMQRDQQAFKKEEEDEKLVKKSHRPSSTASTSHQASIKKKSREPKSSQKRPPPRQSLCASHPALYNQATLKVKTVMSSTPSDSVLGGVSLDPPHSILPAKHPAMIQTPQWHSQHVSSADIQNESLQPWTVYKDPRRLQSREPHCPDPMARYLKMDTNPHQPCVVSPCVMIMSPLGDMFEAAHIYPDDRSADEPTGDEN